MSFARGTGGVKRKRAAAVEKVETVETVEEARTTATNGYVDLGLAYKSCHPEFISDPTCLVIYTDGACLKNGTVGAAAGMGVYFGPDDPRNVSEPVPSHYAQTNQTAELMALEIAVKVAQAEILAGRFRRSRIFTDSNYAIKCVTEWVNNWERNGWITSNGTTVKYKELVLSISSILRALPVIELVKVKGHSGVVGNEMADDLARAAAIRVQKAAAQHPQPSAPPTSAPSSSSSSSAPSAPLPLPTFVILNGRRYELVEDEHA